MFADLSAAQPAPSANGPEAPGKAYAPPTCGRTPMRAQFRSAARLSLLIASAIYVATAIAGFVAFGGRTQSNLLVNLQPGPTEPLPDALVPTLHAAFVGTMITTFPTLSFGLRTAIHTLCLPHAAETAGHRWGEAIVLVALVYLFAIAADDLCFVFQVVGSTCGSLLMFILPAGVYLRGPARCTPSRNRGPGLGFGFVGGSMEDDNPSPDTTLMARAVAWFVLSIGLVVFVGSTAASVANMLADTAEREAASV